ncbi:hypothetical protein D4Q52_14805 [Rhodopseudomonas palustris]|uniref:Uncharacterized protein n=2 Tax=Rhodopseudomonas palustris TaxID=1076 RepID=A0A418V447_RHOPL|nr:hypothetical protein D4Q52_14805 [Rhodopseudomonas palustris]
MVAQNADPDFVARRRGAVWSAERRAAKAAEMTERNADPAFHDKKVRGIAMRKRGRLQIPVHCHPLVRGLVAAMNAQMTTQREVGRRAGLSDRTVAEWRLRTMPFVDALDAALNTLDLELAIVPIGSRDANGFVNRRRATP